MPATTAETKIITITGYADADIANDEDRKSISGYIVYVDKPVVSWNSRKQKCIALSTAQAEYISISEMLKEILYFKQVLNELKMDCKIRIFCDNQAAITIAKNPADQAYRHQISFHSRSYSKPQHRTQLRELRRNPADILTKALPRPAFEQLRANLNLS